MNKALDWGDHYVKITDSDRELFEEARRSFLFHNGNIWVKIKNPHFDVGMGSYDGAEVCELVGLYLLDEIVKADIGLKKENLGLYRDDGLGVSRASNRQMGKMEVALRKIFENHALKVVVHHSMKSTDFLDLRLHLDKGVYEPFRKEGNTPLYINRQSNHPPALIKHLPRMIEKMVSDNCSSEEIFNRHKGN